MSYIFSTSRTLCSEYGTQRQESLPLATSEVNLGGCRWFFARLAISFLHWYKVRMRLGVDQLGNIENCAIAVLAHQASLTSDGVHVVDHLKTMGANIVALFGPEHGFEGVAQDMVAVKNGQTPNTQNPTPKIPIYSLYGSSYASLKPTPKMFEGIDCLVVDLQDIGSRYYTYIYTMAFCMQTAFETNTKVIVCDRPNPINGIDIEGPLIEPGYESFVGLYPLPNRHGMTIGELANFFNTEYNIGCDLEIIKMEGWNRNWYWDERGIDWTNPSPNMRSLFAALLYPGMCLIEGTNISEGRGTKTPFEHAGAPFIEGGFLAKLMKNTGIPGVQYKGTTFKPGMQKWKLKSCGGIKLQITDRKSFRPYRTGLAILHTLKKYPNFKWRTEEYEFRSDVPAIDLLTGSPMVREMIDGGCELEELYPLTETPETFLKKRTAYLLYP